MGLSTELYASIAAGAGQWVAAPPNGCAYACFGWADDSTGTVANARTSSTQQLGFVLPKRAGWARVYRWQGRRYIRAGMPVTLVTRGDFWVRFMAGANSGDRVYANPLDGSALSGPSYGLEETPWVVMTAAAPGELAIMSSWTLFA